VYRCSRDPHLVRDTGRLGCSCGNGLYIKLDSTVPMPNQESALLHEIIEQINSQFELHLEHPAISILEVALYQVIQDNPEIFLPATGEENQSC